MAASRLWSSGGVSHVEASCIREGAAKTKARPLHQCLVSVQLYHHRADEGPVYPLLEHPALEHIDVIQLIVSGGHTLESQGQGLGVGHGDHPLARLPRAVCLQRDGTKRMHSSLNHPWWSSQCGWCLASVWSDAHQKPRNISMWEKSHVDAVPVTYANSMEPSRDMGLNWDM